MKAKVNKTNIQVVQDNIYSLAVTCVVTVTGPNLTLDPILAKLTGQPVLDETRHIAWAEVGEAVITGAGNLENKQKIIHAVGPRWGEPSARGKLANVTWRCLELAEKHELKSIALPPISVGTLGYPLESCARIMFEEIIDFTFEKPKHLKTIILCVDDTPNALDAFVAELKRQLEDLQENGEGTVRV